MGKLKRTTMNDIAKEAGVSQATVSFVLNNRTNSGVKISESTKQKVIIAAEKLNYSLNDAAKALVTGHFATMNGIFSVGNVANLPDPAINLDSNVIKRPDEMPAPVGARPAQDVEFTIVTNEITAKLDDGTSFSFWTFNGTVPGPMIRARIGDNVTIHLQNDATSEFTHSVDSRFRP